MDITHISTSTPLPQLPPASTHSLLACARARTDFSWLKFRDHAAERLLHRFPQLCSPPSDERMLLAGALRAAVIDHVAVSFCRRIPGGSGVSPFAGVSTRGLRLRPFMRWMDLDEPEISHFKRQAWPPARGVRQRQGKNTDIRWCRDILRGENPLFVVLDEAWVGVSEQHWTKVFRHLSHYLPVGSEIAAVRPAGSPLRPQNSDSEPASLEFHNQHFSPLRFLSDGELPEVAQRLLARNRSLNQYGAPDLQILRVQ